MTDKNESGQPAEPNQPTDDGNQSPKTESPKDVADRPVDLKPREVRATADLGDSLRNTDRSVDLEPRTVTEAVDPEPRTERPSFREEAEEKT